MIKQQW